MPADGRRGDFVLRSLLRLTGATGLLALVWPHLLAVIGAISGDAVADRLYHFGSALIVAFAGLLIICGFAALRLTFKDRTASHATRESDNP